MQSALVWHFASMTNSETTQAQRASESGYASAMPLQVPCVLLSQLAHSGILSSPELPHATVTPDTGIDTMDSPSKSPHASPSSAVPVPCAMVVESHSPASA